MPDKEGKLNRAVLRDKKEREERLAALDKAMKEGKRSGPNLRASTLTMADLNELAEKRKRPFTNRPDFIESELKKTDYQKKYEKFNREDQLISRYFISSPVPSGGYSNWLFAEPLADDPSTASRDDGMIGLLKKRWREGVATWGPKKSGLVRRGDDTFPEKMSWLEYLEKQVQHEEDVWGLTQPLYVKQSDRDAESLRKSMSKGYLYFAGEEEDASLTKEEEETLLKIPRQLGKDSK